MHFSGQQKTDVITDTSCFCLILPEVRYIPYIQENIYRNIVSSVRNADIDCNWLTLWVPIALRRRIAPVLLFELRFSPSALQFEIYHRVQDPVNP